MRRPQHRVGSGPRTQVKTVSKPSAYRIVAAVGALGVLALLILGAFISGRHVKGSIDGFSKIQFEIFEKTRQQAVESAPKPTGPPISKNLPPDLADRIQRDSRQLAGASILWVDDGGALQNSWERRALSSLGVSIDTPTTTDQALALLQSGLGYDVIITDLRRKNHDPVAPCYPGSTKYVNAGCRFIQEAKRLCGDSLAPVIVYSAGLDETAGQPPYVQGMTNRFDRLTGFVLDAVERRPEPTPENLKRGAACVRNPLSGA